MDSLDTQDVVQFYWLVERRQNLAALDTFNEEDDGPIDRLDATYTFLVEEDAEKFFNNAKNMLRFAGCAGDYYTRPVKRAFPEPSKRTILLSALSETGGFYQFYWAAKKEICWRCDGEGVHVNPSIDGHGISPDEFAEDPDFEEAYFGGRYDVRCEKCQGEKVIAVPDIDSMPGNLSTDVARQLMEEDKNDRRDREASRRGY